MNTRKRSTTTKENTRTAGYKVTLIQHVKSKIVVVVILTGANVSDNKSLLLTVCHAVTILGKGVIKTLVFDKVLTWAGWTNSCSPTLTET